ncbi:MAG: STAS/SEC14 domain-containing protein [Candidatus Aminicenantes bacterium]|nr:STAS/SEC14 domain-containing protein [Candidatus Aminicenantes bacterium]
MTKFKEAGFYEITVDPSKNMYTLVFLGHWNTPEDIPNYLEHMEKTLALLKTGFSCLVFINDDKPPKLAITKVQKKAQKMQLAAGIKKAAVVLKKKKILQKLSLTVIGKLSGLDIKVFQSEPEAEHWLNEE